MRGLEFVKLKGGYAAKYKGKIVFGTDNFIAYQSFLARIERGWSIAEARYQTIQCFRYKGPKIEDPLKFYRRIRNATDIRAQVEKH